MKHVFDDDNAFSITLRSNETGNKVYVSIDDQMYTNYFSDHENASEKNFLYNNQ